MARARGGRRTRDGNAVLKASLFLAASGALLLGMYFLYGRLGRTWRGVFEYRVLFAQLHKLLPTEPIRYNGMELGRVRDVRVAKLQGELLKNLRPIGKNDLRNLPLTDSERGAIGLAPDEAVDALVRKAVAGRYMTVVTLEVLLDQDEKRLHDDDAYFVSCSAIGESAIEVVTGRGGVLQQRPGVVLLGINADLISDIGKSMEQIAELMRNMAEMVGGKRGASKLVSGQLVNLDSFSRDLDNRTADIAKQIPHFWDTVDARLQGADKDMDELLNNVLALRPQIDDALATTNKSIASIHDDLSGSTGDADKALADYRGLARAEIERWHKAAAELRETFPARAQELREMSKGALDASGQLDDILDQVELKMRESVANARASLNDSSAAALGVQESTWHFKKNVGHFTSKFTRDELAAKHQNWRKDMARQQYVELRRELAAIQARLSVADAADVERARHVEQLLSESDAFFGVNRNDFPPGADVPAPRAPANGLVRPGIPVPLNATPSPAEIATPPDQPKRTERP